MITMMRGSNYITKFLDPKTLLLVQSGAVKLLTDFGLDNFDAIAFCGISGALVAPAVAAMLDKELIVVRKRQDSSHSQEIVEGPYTTKKYVIIDDLVESGKTARIMIENIHYRLSEDAKCVALCLYNQSDGSYNHGAKFEYLPYSIDNYIPSEYIPVIGFDV